MSIRRFQTVLAALVVLLATLGYLALPQPRPLTLTAAPKVAPAAPKAAAPAPPPCNPRASLRPSASLTPASVLSASSMAAIKKRGFLIGGTSQDTLLFSSRNPFTGALEGFDVDMLREIAKALLGDPNKVELKVIAYSDRVQDVADGTVDLVADTMTINCSRLQKINFSTVYYDAGQRLLVSSTSRVTSINQLGGHKVCAAAGSTSLDNLTDPQLVHATSKIVVVPADTQAACLVKFQQNEAEGISTDDVILTGLAAQDPYAKIVGPPFTHEPYGIGVSKDRPELTQFVNAVLERERLDGTWARIYARWLGKFGPVPAPPAAEYLP